MISIKIEGLEQTIKSIKSIAFIDDDGIDAIVKDAAEPLVQTIKNNYITRKHNKIGALVNSIQSFQRKRKSKSDPYFTYYVGPRYSNNGNSYGGNVAHWLEYGTAERYRANVKMGGVGKRFKGKSTGISGVYGAKHETGRIERPTIGVIRQSYDEYKAIGIAAIKAKIMMYLTEKSRKEGLAA